MRILSQDKMIDLPYERFIVSLNIQNPKEIIAWTGKHISDDECIVLGTYSTRVRAEMAMEMLHEAYSPVLVIKEHQEGLKPNIKPNDWLLTPALPTQRIEVADNFYFQFPSDDEVEV